MKLLLAGPGTGKTTRIKELVNSQQNLDKVLVLSFTNATIQDLLKNFADSNIDITERNCLTLHKYALRINHQKNLHILNAEEVKILESYAKKFQIDFGDLCRTLGCITFEQMITQTTAYIKSNPLYLENLIGDIELLVVDEYQDFNPTERELIDLIVKNAQETIILGDDDQCIYEFKDADTDGIINLNNESSVVKIPHDNICFRCPDCVVQACVNLINKNKRRVPKEWKVNSKLGTIEHKQLRTQDDTARYIVSEIQKIKAAEPDSSIMVLSAVQFVLDRIYPYLNDNQIQFTDMWATRLDTEKMKRIWEVRAIFGNKKALNLLFLIYQAIKNNKKTINIIKNKLDKSLDFQGFLSLIEQNKLIGVDLLTMIKQPPKLDELLLKGEYAFLSEHLKENTLEEDLEKVSKLMAEPTPFGSKGVNTLSIHKSKGLQADYVFMVGMVEGIIPNVLRGMDTIEAQRRLLFVGMSRVRKHLCLVSTVEWDSKYVNKVDKKSFKYDYRIKKYLGSASTFIGELNL